jgi:hypothetical protein
MPENGTTANSGEYQRAISELVESAPRLNAEQLAVLRRMLSVSSR